MPIFVKLLKIVHQMDGCKIVLILLLALFSTIVHGNSKTLTNKEYKYKFTLPQNMIPVLDTTNVVLGSIYFDSSIRLVMQITRQESKFHSVKDYIDCSREQLEHELQYCYSDSLLHLSSCDYSPYYPEKITIINIELSILPPGYTRSVIYFIHHHNKDIQFSFMFGNEFSSECLRKITTIMNSLKLN